MPDFKIKHSYKTVNGARKLVVSYSELRQNLKTLISHTTSTHEPVLITHRNDIEAVVLSYEDYESLIETAHLLKNPAMAKILFDAVSDVKEGNVVEHAPIALDNNLKTVKNNLK